jgi:hypothetical protein
LLFERAPSFDLAGRRQGVAGRRQGVARYGMAIS